MIKHHFSGEEKAMRYLCSNVLNSLYRYVMNEDTVFNDIIGVSVGHFSIVAASVKVLRSLAGIKSDLIC